MKTLFLSLLLSLNIFSAEVKVTDFTLKGYADGKEFKLSDHLGKKTILLNFWATWCTACLKELPELHALKKKYPDALFVGINSGEKKKHMKKFFKRNKFNYLILVDRDMTVAGKYGIDAIPVTIVISKDKKIIHNSDKPPKKL